MSLKQHCAPCSAITSALLLAVSTLYAGPLNPPAGPVAPTGKTLTEVEPRIAINATNTPGDADSLFRITQPGSYYLTGNITGVANKFGIEIAADGVTLDLNGFTMQGVANVLDGVRADGARSLITIKNGTVGGWSVGIRLAQGASGEAARITDVLASGNVSNGIIAPALSVLTNCQALNTLNPGAVGILTGVHCTLTNCAAHVNSGFGIVTGASSTLSHCVSSNNGGGISVGTASVMIGCAAKNNGGNGIEAFESSTIKDCTAYQNGADGIQCSLACTVTGCTTNYNTGDGIQVSSGCVVSGNTSVNNGFSGGSGAGVHALSFRNRIEGNQCTNNDRGIDVDAGSNFIIRNTCGLNGTDWDIINGNYIGPIFNPIPNTTPVNTSTYPGSVGTQDPHANFTLN